MKFREIYGKDHTLWTIFYDKGSCPNCETNFGDHGLVDDDKGWDIEVINERDFLETPIKCSLCKNVAYIKYWFNPQDIHDFLDSLKIEWPEKIEDKNVDLFLKKQRDDLLASVFS